MIAKRSLEGEALAFLGVSPPKILKIEKLRYAFSALLGVFLSQNKGSKVLSWIVTKLKSPKVRYGWVGLFYVCENQPAFYEHHTGWAWLSLGEHRCVLIFSSKSFLSMAAETLTTSRNSNAIETRLVSTPFGSSRAFISRSQIWQRMRKISMVTQLRKWRPKRAFQRRRKPWKVVQRKAFKEAKVTTGHHECDLTLL